MDERQKQSLMELAKQHVQFDVPLNTCTTYKIGGRAKAFFRAVTSEDLKTVLRFLKIENIPFFVIGEGSNLLVKDSGFDGVIIRLEGEFLDVGKEHASDDDKFVHVYAGAGLSISNLLLFCRKNGLSGLEFLAGIPGSVGGAAVMNAGAFGNEIENFLQEVWMIPGGDLEISRITKSLLSFSYRAMNIERDAVITGVSFNLERKSVEDVSSKIAENLKKRKINQPLECNSAGSVFKNPQGDYAGRIIEMAGLKGLHIGDAEVSCRHANFIVNRGNATADDVLSLIKMIQEKVKEKFDILLELEIKIVGN